MTTPTPIRLLHVYRTMNAAETERALALAGMPEFDLSVICSMTCDNHRRLLEAGVPVQPLDFRRKTDVAAIAQLRRRVQAIRPDLVHAFTSRTVSGALLATSWMKTPPAIVAYRGIMEPVKRYDPVAWITYLHPRLAGVTCISDSCRDALRHSGVRRPLLRTVHLGHCHTPGERRPYTEFGVPEGAFVVAFVGNIRPVKGIDVLLRAARRLSDLPDVHFLLMGEVRDCAVAAEAARPELKDRIHLAGRVPDAQRLVGDADLFVMPSRREGLCKAVMEAMARGVCPIISNVGGMPELVRHERDGLIVEPEDPAALAAAIRTLHADSGRRRVYGESARQRILEDFSIERMTQRTCQLYFDVLDRTAARITDRAA